MSPWWRTHVFLCRSRHIPAAVNSDCRLLSLPRVCSVCLQPDLTNLQLDDKLEPIFGTKQLSTAALPQALGRLLEPLKPITVTHNIV